MSHPHTKETRRGKRKPKSRKAETEMKVLALPETVLETLKHDQKNIDSWHDPNNNGASTSGSSSTSSVTVHTSHSRTPNPKVLHPVSGDNPLALSTVPVDRDISLKELIELGDVFEVIEVEYDCCKDDFGSGKVGETFDSMIATVDEICNEEDANKEEAEKERRKRRRFRILKMFSLKGNKKI